MSLIEVAASLAQVHNRDTVAALASADQSVGVHPRKILSPSVKAEHTEQPHMTLPWPRPFPKTLSVESPARSRGAAGSPTLCDQTNGGLSDQPNNNFTSALFPVRIEFLGRLGSVACLQIEADGRPAFSTLGTSEAEFAELENRSPNSCPVMRRGKVIGGDRHWAHSHRPPCDHSKIFLMQPVEKRQI